MDDSLHNGTDEFLELTKQTEQRFKSKPRDFDKFKFAGVQIERTTQGILIHQKEYASRIRPLPQDADFKVFRSLRQRLQWLTHTRPDIACAVNKSTQVTSKMFSPDSIRAVNVIVKQVFKYPDRGILQRKLDKHSLHIRVYTDGSFADNSDLTTQLGYIILMCEKNNNCNILHYSSYKSSRVVRSVLGGETYAFADGMDFGITLKHDMENMISINLPIKLYTDSKSLFDVITKNTTTTEKTLMIDIKALREAYIRMDIKDVAWIKREHNPADALTKVKEKSVLNKIIDDGVIEHHVQQWTIRNR